MYRPYSEQKRYLERVEAFLVLGGENPKERNRSRYAASLWLTAHNAFGRNPHIIASGKTSLNNKSSITEAEEMARTILLNAKIPSNRIRVETCSVDTLTNFIYSREIIDDIGARNIGVVTDQFHIKRALWCGKRVLGRRYNILPLHTYRRHRDLTTVTKESMARLIWSMDLALLDTRVFDISGKRNKEFFESYIEIYHPIISKNPSPSLYYLALKMLKVL